MAGLSDFRAKHPEYNDMGDVELADALHQKFYADIPRKEFDRTLGIQTSQGLGFVKGGFKAIDNAAMALEAGAKRVGVPTDRVNNFFASPSAAEATENRAQAIAATGKRPGALGEIAGGVVGTIPVMAVTKNPFASGAIGGALMTDKRDVRGVAMDAAVGGALGWGTGKVMDAAADFIKPVIDPAVRRLHDAGVRLTPGMIGGRKAMVREDKMMSRPVVGDRIRAGREAAMETFNTAAANRALAPIGVKIPPNVRPGNDSIAFAKRTLSDAYDAVIPKMAVVLDPRGFTTKLQPSAANLEGPQRKQLQALLNQHLKNGQLAGQKLKDAHGELRRLASSYSRDQAAPNRELGKVLFEAADDLMAAMSAQNKALAPQLARVNEAYRGYKIVAGAAKGADDGIFNTSQLKQSVVRGDRSKDKDAAAQGKAFLQDFSNDARTVLPSRIPNSGTADRNMSANIFANARGLVDDLGYRASEQVQRVRMAPRGSGATRAAQTVKRLKAPATAAAVSAGSRRD